MPKKGSLLQPVQILKLVAGGNVEGEYHAEGQQAVVLYFDARSVVPGDLVIARVLGKRGGLWQGKLESILRPSIHRQNARCSHFGTCGGCGLQHWPYSIQLQQKEQLVWQCLESFMDRTVCHPALGCKEQWFFRNKMEYTSSARAWQEIQVDSSEPNGRFESPAFGLFVPFSGNKVLDIKSCLLQEPIGDAIRNWWRQYALENHLSAYHSSRHDGWLRTLLIRTTRTGKSLVMFIVASPNPEGGPDTALEVMVSDFVAAMPMVSSVWTLVNSKMNDSYADLVPVHAAGVREIEEEIDGLKFRIGPQTFFQVNSRQTRLLYDRIIQLADLNSSETVYDLYCGVGSISAYLARHAQKVIGIEYVDASVDAARQNAQLNDQGNLLFIAGDMKDLFVPKLFETHGFPDVVVTDPPRAGMHPKACETLAASDAKKIVYVSCNPQSLARDLSILVPRYRLSAVQVVDLMPQSHHVETIVLLEKS